MIQILIIILQFLGVCASPDLLNNPDFNARYNAEIKKADEIYKSHHYREVDGTVIVDTVNP